jgi:hypothetical protein
MHEMIKSTVIFAVIMFCTSQAFAWDDICQMGGELNYMTSLQAQKHFDDNVRGKNFSGRGKVRNVWEYGVNKYHAVAVDCENDVTVNVATTSRNLDNLRAGEYVSFDGRCIDGSRRSYANTHNIYAHFELDGGSIQ